MGGFRQQVVWSQQWDWCKGLLLDLLLSQPLLSVFCNFWGAEIGWNLSGPADLPCQLHVQHRTAGATRGPWEAFPRWCWVRACVFCQSTTASWTAEGACWWVNLASKTPTSSANPAALPGIWYFRKMRAGQMVICFYFWSPLHLQYCFDTSRLSYQPTWGARAASPALCPCQPFHQCRCSTCTLTLQPPCTHFSHTTRPEDLGQSGTRLDFHLLDSHQGQRRTVIFLAL